MAAVHLLRHDQTQAAFVYNNSGMNAITMGMAEGKVKSIKIPPNDSISSSISN